MQRHLTAFALASLVTLMTKPSLAHVHGEAHMGMALDDTTLAITLEAPLESLAGFEHPPRTVAQKQVLLDLASTLQDPARVFQLPPEAQCTAQAPSVNLPFASGKTRESREGHAEVTATYRWQCGRPGALREVATALFARFPRLVRIEVAFAGPGQQKSGRMTPAKPGFEWHPAR